MKRIASFASILIAFVFLAVTAISFMDTLSGRDLVEFTDISEYGHYSGSGMDSFTEEFVNSFFPVLIEDHFSNVRYSYKAGGNNTYGFEVYLEFTISDRELFWQFIDGIGSSNSWKPFSFDTGFNVFDIDNRLDINEDIIYDRESNYYHPIERAKIRRVFYSEESQTIIFWALGVYDGGGIGTNYLNTFFDRFQIDPIDYEMTADSPYGEDPYKID